MASTSQVMPYTGLDVLIKVILVICFRFVSDSTVLFICTRNSSEFKETLSGAVKSGHEKTSL